MARDRQRRLNRSAGFVAILVTGVLTVWPASGMAAQQVRMGDTLFLTFPVPPTTLKIGDGFFSSTRFEAKAEIALSSGRLAIDGDTSWASTFVPRAAPWVVTSSREDRKKQTARLRITSSGRITRVLNLEISGWAPERRGEVFLQRSGLQSAIDSAVENAADNLFRGLLSEIPREQQRALVLFASAASDVEYGVETYRDSLWFRVSSGETSDSYNDGQLNTNAILARVFDGQLLSLAKVFAAAAKDVAPLEGLKLEVQVLHRMFGQTAANTRSLLEVYFPSALIQKFTNQDITSQDLLDGSVVIYDGNRVRVNLQTG